MVLTSPKRLFHVPTMSTVFYENVVDDVKKKGYAAISHVWGEQTMYSVDELGVKCGIDWDIPLSDLEKMDKLKESMSHYEMEYCWFDVFCMPQNKIHEVNAEVPFMGDYYAGAAITLVISRKSGFALSNGWKTGAIDLTEPQGIANLASSAMRTISNNFAIDDDEWFTRVWTFQEAVLSKNTKYIGSNEMYMDLSAAFDKLDARNVANNTIKTMITANLSKIGNAIKCHREGQMDLIGVMSRHVHRNCYKPQDKFYGALGILGYKDFVVDYNIKMEDLNRKIIQHAYSRGDMSWLSAGTLHEYGFIQPLYNAFDCVGTEWHEEIPGICDIKFQSNALQINTYTAGTVTQCTHWTKSDGGDNFVTWAVEEFRDWKLKDDIIVRTLAAGQHVPESSFVSLGAQIYNPIRAIKRCGGNPFKILPNISITAMSSVGEWIDTKCTMFEENASTRQSIAMISYATGEQKPLVIHGHPDVGDTIMLLRMHDKFGRILGFVVDKSFKRKGLCLCEKIEMTEEEAVSRYLPHEFPL